MIPRRRPQDAHGPAGDPAAGDCPVVDRPPAFERACDRAAVVPGHRPALWRLLTSWQTRRDEPDRLRAVLEDYGHWLLYRQSQDGDPVAARQFEEYWRDAINAYLGRGFTVEQVEEFRGLFFERVYRTAPSFAWSTPFVVWLRTVLLNISRDELRRLRRRRDRLTQLDDVAVATTPSGERDPEQALLRKERGAQVQRAVAALHPVDRYILRASLLDDRSGEDLAASLGIARDALYQRLSRAKKRLRRALGDGARSDG